MLIGKVFTGPIRANETKTLGAELGAHNFEMVDADANFLPILGMALEQPGKIGRSASETRCFGR